MNVASAVKGWCPDAYRPMLSGDGLIVRIRPRLARLTRTQVLGICALAQQHGSGMLEFTNRANLQIRGVRDADHAPLVEALAALGLLDAEPGLEARRNVLITPLWAPDDLTTRLNDALLSRLAALPALPSKFGFAIDTGPAPVLQAASADIHLERDATGSVIVRADGAPSGRTVDERAAIDAVVAMTQWFAQAAPSFGVRRMAPLLEKVSPPDDWRGVEPASADALPEPGSTSRGYWAGLPFGQVDAGALSHAMHTTGAMALRFSPWRLVLFEGGMAPPAGIFITEPGNPLLAADACPGAPFCASASVETRALARMLAPQVDGTLHVSGCAKGCARNRSADVTLVGHDGMFNLVEDGCAFDEPVRRGLAPTDLVAELG